MLLEMVCLALATVVGGLVVYFVQGRSAKLTVGRLLDVEKAKAAAEAQTAALQGELRRMSAEHGNAVRALEQKLADVEAENCRLKVDQARKAEIIESGNKRIEDMTRHYLEMRDTAKAEFETLAQKVLDERSAKLKAEGNEQFRAVVDGLAQDIRAFQAKLAASDVESARNNSTLQERIAQLVGQTNAVTAQACNLAEAIRGEAQLTGEWGEIQLRRVLESAGMCEGQGFSYQETFCDPDTGKKTKRTDFVIKLPGARSLIIDSKTTVQSALDYRAARTEEEKSAALKAIIGSVENHIDEIIRAKYQTVVPNAFPTVLMYVPVDEVYILAMKAKLTAANATELVREYAARNNVAIVNSSSVVPVVRLIQMMWESESVKKNSDDIIAAAQEILRRCNAFVEKFEEVGDRIDEACASYAEAKAKLVDAPGRQSITKAVNSLVELKVPPKTKQGLTLKLCKTITDAAQSEA